MKKRIGGKNEQAEKEDSKLFMDLPTDLKKAFKAKASMEGRSMVDVVRELIEIYVKKNNKD